MEQKKEMSRLGEAEQFPISYEPHKTGTYNIYLFGAIESPSQFIGALEVMRNAGENDIVVIHLQSCGGSLDATDTLITGIRECAAPIVVRASGGCHSAASIILLEAEHFTLSENFSCLIHNGSTGSGGKFSDYVSETKFTAKWMEKVLRNSYEGFLSATEIDDLVKGIDIWLDTDDWMKRADARNEYIAAKKEAEDEAEEAAILKMIAEDGTKADKAVVKKPRKDTKKAMREADEIATKRVVE